MWIRWDKYELDVPVTEISTSNFDALASNVDRCCAAVG